jgi:hypothetical protein
MVIPITILFPGKIVLNDESDHSYATLRAAEAYMTMEPRWPRGQRIFQREGRCVFAFDPKISSLLE